MIRSFAYRDTEALFHSRPVVRCRNIERAARRKLLQLQAVTELASLSVPPGNRLEALRGDRKGRHSIRINDQWRACFIWRTGGPHQVEIVDCHQEGQVTRLLDEIHPGEILLEEFMKPMRLASRDTLKRIAARIRPMSSVA